MKNIFFISFGFSVLLLSCSSDETQISTIDLKEFESSELITRSSEKKFDSEIEAGRQLAKLWNTMEEINLRDTQEFFFDMNDLFGPSD